MTKHLKSKRKIIRRGRVRYELVDSFNKINSGSQTFPEFSYLRSVKGPGDYLIYRKVTKK